MAMLRPGHFPRDFTLVAEAAAGVLHQITGVLQASGQTPSRFVMLYDQVGPILVFRFTVACDEAVRGALETAFTKLATVRVISVSAPGALRPVTPGSHGDRV